MGDVRKRRKVNKIDWIKRYEEWQSSGQKQEIFCKDSGLNYYRFKQQTSRLIRSGEVKSLRKMDSRQDSFVPIVVGGSQKKESEAPYCEIKFRFGGRIIVEELNGIQELGQILQGFRHV